MHPPQPTLLAIWSAATLLAIATPAWAVVPGLTGPLQALAQLVPQILPFLMAGLAGLLGSRAWRERLGRLGRWLATPRGLFTACILVTAVGAGAYLARPADRSRIAVAASVRTAPAKAVDWPLFRGSLLRTGRAADTMGPEKARVLWSFSDPEIRVADLASSPAVVGDRVYVGSAQASIFDSTGMVYCLDAHSGKRVWQFETAKQVFSSPAVVGGRVYVGEGFHVDTGCRLYCLDAATGKQLWATTTKSHTESSPAVVGGRAYFGAGEDGIYCLDAATGKPRWQRGGMHVDASPAVEGGRVYLGTGYGRLAALALDAATGKTLWSIPCDLPVWGPPTVSGGRVYFGIGNGDFVKSNPVPKGGVLCLDAATGKQAWRTPLPDAVLTALPIQGDRILAGCRDGRLYALEAATGEIIWRADCGGPVVASPATDGTRVYVPGGMGKVLALNLADGKPVWALDLVPHTAPGVQLFSSPALAHGRLYLGTSKEKLLCLGP